MSNVINGFSFAVSYADFANHGILGENNSAVTTAGAAWGDYSDSFQLW